MIFDQTRLFQVLGYAGLKNFSFSFMVVKSNLGEEKHMKIAERIERLGTETAFAVSAEAAAFAAKGNKVYPFHLGDMNIITRARPAIAPIPAFRNCVKFWRLTSAPHGRFRIQWRMWPFSRAANRPSANLSWR
jgi:hypothetical protein